MNKNNIHNFWKNPDPSNFPIQYLTGEERSEFLLGLIKKYAKPNSRILEIGCNVGRNLNYLYTHGFKDLTGVEINKEAVDLLKSHYKLPIKVYNEAIEDRIKKLRKYDIIFSMAVFEHIHTDSDWIFPEIQKRAKILITIEDENSKTDRHFPRCYKNIFKNQIEEIQLSKNEGLDINFKARIFYDEQK